MENYRQKYEQALERAKGMHEQGMMPERIEYIFPELKESEDERTRKEIIDYLDREIALSNFGGDIATFKKWIDWLEKQGEYANFRNKIQIGDKVTRNESGVLVNISQLNRIAKKRGEQKPVDNVEPKFKAGDWVVNYTNHTENEILMLIDWYLNRIADSGENGISFDSHTRDGMQIHMRFKKKNEQ